MDELSLLLSSAHNTYVQGHPSLHCPLLKYSTQKKSLAMCCCVGFLDTIISFSTVVAVPTAPPPSHQKC